MEPQCLILAALLTTRIKAIISSLQDCWGSPRSSAWGGWVQGRAGADDPALAALPPRCQRRSESLSSVRASGCPKDGGRDTHLRLPACPACLKGTRTRDLQGEPGYGNRMAHPDSSIVVFLPTHSLHLFSAYGHY